MSEEIRVAGPRVRLRAALRSVPLWCVVAFGGCYALEVCDFGFVRGDEGAQALAGWRVAEGQVPHRDFFLMVTPFSFLVTGAWFRLFGVSIASERALVLGYGLLLVLLADRMLVRYTRDVWARSFVLSFLIPAGVLGLPTPSYHWVVDLAQLAAALALLKSRGVHLIAWSVSAGALTALGFFSLQDQGAYFPVALMILYFPWIRDRRSRWTTFAGWVTGGAAVCCAFALYLLPRVPLADLAYQWIRFPASRYRGLPGNVGSLSGTIRAVIDPLRTVEWWESAGGSPALLVGQRMTELLLALLPLLAACALGLAAAKRWSERENLGLLAALCAAFFGACLHRYTIANIAWAAPPLLISVAWALGELRRETKMWMRALAAAVSVGACGVALLYAGGRMEVSRNQPQVLVQSRAGTVRLPRSAVETHPVSSLVAAVERHVPPDGHLVTIGFFGTIANFWTLRRNPTRFNYFLYGPYHTEDQARDLIDSLESNPLTYVVLSSGIDASSLLGAHLQSHYLPVWRGGPLVLAAPRAGPRGAE